MWWWVVYSLAGLSFLTEALGVSVGSSVHNVFWFSSWQLQIWDTAGQERFRSITQSYYRSANALILVYDVCSQQSYESLPHWIHEIELYAGTKVLAFLVGKYQNSDGPVYVSSLPLSLIHI